MQPEYRSSNFERETFYGPTQLLPELEIFGWLRFRSAATGFLRADRHPGTFEIHYLRRGHLKWWVEGSFYNFRPGSIFVIRPGELHGGDEDALQPCEHYWLRIGFPQRRALAGLTAAELDQIRSGFKDLRCRLFPASPAVPVFFDFLLNEHRHRGPDSVLLARSLLHALLVAILRSYDRVAKVTKIQNATLLTWRVRRMIEMLQQKMHDNAFRISALARKIDLSEAGLRKRFIVETGFTPHEYIIHGRIEEARRRLLETNTDVLRIAIDLGFSSSQYFATVFRKQVGLSPSEYRNRHSKRKFVKG